MYLKSGNHAELYNTTLLQSGRLAIVVGNWGDSALGNYIGICDLWTFRTSSTNLFEDADERPLREHHLFLKKVTSLGMEDMLVNPSFFNVSQEPTDTSVHSEILSYLRILVVFHSLLNLSSHVDYDTQQDTWHLQMVGNKTLHTMVKLANESLLCDGIETKTEYSSFTQLYSWAISNEDSARASIARKTIALYCLSYDDLLKASKQILMSAEASFALWIDQAVSEVIEMNQRFTEYYLDWNNKDIEMNLNLRGITSDTILGGFGSLIGIIVGLVVQSFDSVASNLILLILPYCFVAYLCILIWRTEQIYTTFKLYLAQHEKQLSYYTRILGKKRIEEISGSETLSDLGSNFRRLKWDYQIVLSALAIFAIICWFVMLFTGMITLT